MLGGGCCTGVGVKDWCVALENGGVGGTGGDGMGWDGGGAGA